MDRALIVGGTRFIGRYTVRDLLDHGYEVDIFNRGNNPNPFEDVPEVTHIRGDRTDDDALEAAASESDPDVVIDCVGYYPEEIEAATRIFSDVGAYVFVSSAAAYEPGMPGFERPPGDGGVVKREGVTPLRECTPEQAVDDSPETYGARKAECDRTVFAAADEDINGIVARPCLVYGPHDYTDRVDYWIDRVRRYDRVLTPHDGSKFVHRTYVEDTASALRIIAEEGDPGEAYNIGHRQVVTVDRIIELIAEALDTTVEVVHADDRRLAEADLSIRDFPLFRRYPYVVSTGRLSSLGWGDTPIPEAIPPTVEDHVDNDRGGGEFEVDRGAEEAVIDAVDSTL